MVADPKFGKNGGNSKAAVKSPVKAPARLAVRPASHAMVHSSVEWGPSRKSRVVMEEESVPVVSQSLSSVMNAESSKLADLQGSSWADDDDISIDSSLDFK